MKYHRTLILIIAGLLFASGNIYGQRIFELEFFIEKIREKKESDLISLNCYRFMVHREHIIREDTLTTRYIMTGKEYHYRNQPLLRTYDSAWINNHPLRKIPEPDTLLKEEPSPLFYDENFHRYYTIKDRGMTDLNGSDMRHLHFTPVSRKSGLMKGEAWIDPETYGIIKMTLEPYPLPDGMTKMIIDIFNTYDDKDRVIRYGMQSLNHVITSDRKMEIRIRERYTDYENNPKELCDSLKLLY
jgi:hypothetical protein